MAKAAIQLKIDAQGWKSGEQNRCATCKVYINIVLKVQFLSFEISLLKHAFRVIGLYEALRKINNNSLIINWLIPMIRETESM